MTVEAERPITRSELREEFDRLRADIREIYATKADLAQLELRLTLRMVTIMATFITIASTVIIAVQKLWT